MVASAVSTAMGGGWSAARGSIGGHSGSIRCHIRYSTGVFVTNAVLVRCLGAGSAVAVVAVALAVAPAAAAPLHSLSPSSPAGVELLQSSQPKTAILDTRTGQITAVYAGFAPAAARYDQAVLDTWIGIQK